MWKLLVLSFVCIAGTFCAAIDNSGGCVYSFEVWQPNQDQVKKIQDLEIRCNLIAADMERSLDGFEKKLLKAIIESHNMSHVIERQLMQYRLEDVQITLTIKDVRLEMAEMRSDHTRLWQAFEEAKILKLGDTNLSNLKEQVRISTSLSERLKNSVGDLQAEWLVIKRQVQNLISQNEQLNFGMNDMKTDAIKLKARIEELWQEAEDFKKNGFDVKASMRKKTGKGQVEDQDTYMAKLKEELAMIRYDWKQIKNEVDWMLPNLHSSDTHPQDCHDLYMRGYKTSGVYQIVPGKGDQLDNVYCEMVNNTGWTVLQRRLDGTLSFNRMWLQYRTGFGNPYGEFWIGNEKLHNLTSSKAYKLRVDLWDWTGVRSYAEYGIFKVDAEADKYMLHVGDYKGNAGDSLSYHDRMAFSTEDHDNDHHMRNCAADNKGGWWFNACISSNLNGVYKTSYYNNDRQTFADGIVWYTIRGSEFYSLFKVEMKIRPLHI